MNKPEIVSALITAGIVLGAVAYRLLWAGSQVAAGSGFAGLPVPKKWREWLRGERASAK
jgi:hypothetical protein